MDAKLKRTTLRLPQSLYDRIEAAAVGKLSMNALIIEVLEEAFPEPLIDTFDELVAEALNAISVMPPEERTSFIDSRKDFFDEAKSDYPAIGYVNQSIKLQTIIVRKLERALGRLLSPEEFSMHLGPSDDFSMYLTPEDIKNLENSGVFPEHSDSSKNQKEAPEVTLPVDVGQDDDSSRRLTPDEVGEITEFIKPLVEKEAKKRRLRLTPEASGEFMGAVVAEYLKRHGEEYRPSSVIFSSTDVHRIVNDIINDIEQGNFKKRWT